MNNEIAVVGGGAAGMMAAIAAAERGARVTLLEPNERLGKKLNITGKGRCNVTNNCSMEELLAQAPEDAFVIGGASVYQALIDRCSVAYVTKIQKAFPADCWFPNLDRDPAWRAEEPSEELEQDGVRYRYVTYRRVKQ